MDTRKPMFSDTELQHPYFKADPTLRDKYVGLVGCGKSKRDKTSMARHLYTGQLTQMSFAWVSRNCRRWFILSAGYGLLHPDEPVDPYDTKIDDLTPEDLLEWTKFVKTGLDERELMGCKFLVVAGGNYISALPPVKKIDVCRGLRMGERLKWFKAHPCFDPAAIKDVKRRGGFGGKNADSTG